MTNLNRDVKVLVTEVGTHIVAKVGVINKTDDTIQLINPMLIVYHHEEQAITAKFLKFCSLSDDDTIYMRASYIISMLKPTGDVKLSYLNSINPKVEGDKPECW